MRAVASNGILLSMWQSICEGALVNPSLFGVVVTYTYGPG
jgi:hypothetical protein